MLEYAPASQLTHAAEEFAPVSTEYVPATQLTHTLEPVWFEYFPTGHKAHTPTLVAPVAFEYSPAAQLSHALAPVTVLYFPAAHIVQAPPFGPVYPASHVQLTRNPLEAPARAFAGHALQFGLPSGDHCPSGHWTHVSFPTAPKCTEYNPTEQFEHAVIPSWLLYVPGLQIRHVYAPAACANPLLHQQNSWDTLPATDVAFAWQFLHVAAPAPENVLLGQVTHALAELAPVVTEYVPAVQFTHTVEAVAPVSPEYVPALQFVHALAPVVVEYAPA
jgi:hypothetical protein